TIPDYEGADGIVDYVSVSSSKSADRNAAHLEPALALYSNPTPIEGLAPVIFRKEAGEEKTLYDLKVLFYNEQYRDTFARKQAAEYFEREAEGSTTTEPELCTSTSRRIFTQVLSYVDGPILAEGRTIFLPQSDWDTPHPIFKRLTLEVMNSDVEEYEALLHSGRAVFRYETEKETARGAQVEVLGNIAWEVKNSITNNLELVRTDREAVRPLTADLRNELEGTIRELVRKSVRIEGDPALVLSLVPLMSDGVMEHLITQRLEGQFLEEFFRAQSDFRESLSSHLLAEMARANEEEQREDVKVTYQLTEDMHVRGREKSVGAGVGAIIYGVTVKAEGERTKVDQHVISTLNGWTKNEGVRWKRGTTEDTYLPASIDVVNLGAVDLAVQKGYQSAMSVVENARLSNGVPVFRPATFTTDDIGALKASEEVEVLRLRETAREEAEAGALSATILQDLIRDVQREEFAVQDALTEALSILHALPTDEETFARIPEVVRECQTLLTNGARRATVKRALEKTLRFQPEVADWVTRLLAEGRLDPRKTEYTDPRRIRTKGELAQVAREQAELERVATEIAAHRQKNDAEIPALIAYSTELTDLHVALIRLASYANAQVTRVSSDERVRLLRMMSDEQFRQFRSEYLREYEDYMNTKPMKQMLEGIQRQVVRHGFPEIAQGIPIQDGPNVTLEVLRPVNSFHQDTVLRDASIRLSNKIREYIARHGDGNR
ncbi:hypothetical protein MRY87_07750, partial [bacterium]|nr:hypothetical protein [bacterium]